MWIRDWGMMLSLSTHTPNRIPTRAGVLLVSQFRQRVAFMERSWLKIIWIYLFLVAGLSRIDLAVAGDGAYAVRGCNYEIRVKSSELPSERLPEGQNIENVHLHTRGLGFDNSV